MPARLRKFPYPYQAAMTICSDIDGTSLEDFIEIHKFLNTNQNTSCGRGLSIPIGDSFWMYDNPEIADHAFSYFKDLQGTISTAAPIIRDFIKAGIIDVMHSYGNFTTVSDFSRRIANQSLEELVKQGLKLSVWTNHGGIESVQNIGQNSLGVGDVADNVFYHSDLLINYGIMFYWDAEISLTTNIGQDCPAKFSDAYWKSPLFQHSRRHYKSMIKGLMTLADQILYPLMKRHFIHWTPFNKNQNELISLDSLRDGNVLYRFKRVGLGRFDYADDLPLLLSDQVLEKLIDKNGYLILYIHLGDQRIKQEESPLSIQSINTLKKLADLYHSGKLWITTTGRLLKYNLLTKTVDWTFEETAKDVQIKISGVSSQKNNYDLLEADLTGLTFYVPDNKKVDLFYKDEPIAFRKNPIDHKGQTSISIPIPNIEWPL